jgi:outer membrane protein OmpA-like peptidoglycan-associated protein
MDAGAFESEVPMRVDSRAVRLALTGLLSLVCLAQVASGEATTSSAAPAATPVAQPVKAFSVKQPDSATAPAGAATADKPATTKRSPQPAGKTAAKASAAKTSAAKPAAGAKPAAAAADANPAAAPAIAPDPGQAWIKPFPGSRQTERSTRGFDEYWMPLGKLAGESQADKVARIEGKWVHAAYTTPAGPSVPEVFRHYEQEVAKAGLEVVYTCNGVECGEGGRKSNGDWWELSDNRRYLAARLARPAGDLWVSVHVHARGPRAAVVHEIDVIEARPPVVPPPPRNEAAVATLEKDLEANGRVVLHQLDFVEGRATVLPQSEPVVHAIAELMNHDPGLRLHVVVHSDDSAPWKASMDLTKKRAAAVASLLRKYGVASVRVQPAGVGPLAPIASNATSEGRTLNRRVELVPQSGVRAGGPAATVRR